MDRSKFEGVMDKGWLDKLSPFLMSKEFDDIILALRKEKELGYIICPEYQYLFRAFKVCPYNKLSCIIIGQDPYFTKGVADGVAMSCSLTNVLQPSLKMFYNEINRTVYGSSILEERYNTSLDYLASQGVLLINVALTVREKDPRSHLGLWNGFIEYLFLNVINYYQRGLPIIMLGTEAQKVERYIAPFTHYTLSAEHPAAASYQNREWNCSDVFNVTNNILRRNNGKEFEIQWFNREQ